MKHMTKFFRTLALTEGEFRRLAEFIEGFCGIRMPLSKKTMITSRLQKRLRHLQMDSFSEYVDLVLNPQSEGRERIHFMDLVTTNKTDFFREPYHFAYLAEKAFPELSLRTGAGVRRPFNLWSAPCSTGEEPYTMAMVVQEYAQKHPHLGFSARILGSDLSTRALQTAENGVYDQERVEPVSQKMKQKYMLKSKDPERNLVKMAKEIRDMVHFQQMNFMDSSYSIKEKMDIVFCRNMLIYFDAATVEQVIRRLCAHIHPGGYLMVGHAETLKGIRAPLTPLEPTIYKVHA